MTEYFEILQVVVVINTIREKCHQSIIGENRYENGG